MTRNKNRRDKIGPRPQTPGLPATKPTPDIFPPGEHQARLAISSTQETIVQRSASFHSGPIPSPGDLQAYNAIESGLADRIVRMAEMQLQHRQNLESRCITSDLRRSWGGLTAGFIIALVFGGFGTYAICQGHDVAGASLAGATLVALVGSFLYGTWSRKDERREKARHSSPKETQ